MHILMTANSAWNIVNFRRPIIFALQASGHSVTVLAPPDESVSEIEGLNCRFIPLPMNIKGLNPLDDVRLLRDFRRVFRLEAPDAILSYTIKNNIFGAMAAKPLKKLIIPNVTGLGTAFLAGNALRSLAEQLYRMAFAHLPVVFFQNEDDRALFLRRKLVTEAQAHLLPGSGINLQHFAPSAFPSEETPPTFLMIARILRDKGVLEFVAAAEQVKGTTPQAIFQLLGPVDSENRSAIGAEAVSQWAKEGHIEYLGTTNDVRPSIAAAHCVVLPSYREGAPRTLIEASSMARPVIATDVPGCRSVVDDGVSGLLCEARSSESLALACNQFLAMPYSSKIAMGQAGRAKMAREYDEAIVVQAYQNAMNLLTKGVVPPSFNR